MKEIFANVIDIFKKSTVRSEVIKVSYALVVLCGAYLCLRSFFFLQGMAPHLYRSTDFNHYYSTSVIMLSGQIPYGRPFRSLEIAGSFDYHEQIPMAGNPPLLTLFLSPLALLSPSRAWIIWIGLLLIFSLVCPLIIVRVFNDRFSVQAKVLLLLLWFGSYPVYDIFRFSQVQTILLFLVLLGWYFLRQDRGIACCICWSIGFSLKLILWPLLLYVLLTKKSRVLWLVTCLTIVLLLFLPCLLYGLQIYYDFFNMGIPIIEKWGYSSSLNWSLGQSICRMYHFLIHSSIIEAPRCVILTHITVPIVILLVIVICAAKTKSKDDLDYACAIIATLSFITSMVSWPSYYVAFLFLFSVVIVNNDFNPLLSAASILYYFLFFTKTNRLLLPKGVSFNDIRLLLNPFAIDLNCLSYTSQWAQAIMSVLLIVVMVAPLLVASVDWFLKRKIN